MNDAPPRSKQRSSQLLNVILVIMLVNVIAIAFYAISKCCECGARCHVFQILAVAGGTSAAFLMLGGLLGFLFSIPRAGAENQTTDYPDNSNLVDISDWLTKILVGAGLVTLTKIPPKLGLLADYLGKNGFNDEKNGPVFALVIVLSSAVCGFLWVYVWTRLNFSHDLSTSRLDLKSLLKAASESPVATLLLRALSLPATRADDESKALREHAKFMGRTQLAENPESRKIAIQYSRLLDEQFNDRNAAKQVLTDALAARRNNKTPPDVDDAALHYNLACYINREARIENDPAKKEKLRSEAKEHLQTAIQLDPTSLEEGKKDGDLNDLQM